MTAAWNLDLKRLFLFSFLPQKTYSLNLKSKTVMKFSIHIGPITNHLSTSFLPLAFPVELNVLTLPVNHILSLPIPNMKVEELTNRL